MDLAQQTPTRPLGRTGIAVSALGTGTNRWRQGDNDAAVAETYKALLDGGADFIDTAEVYGFGKSERLIGDCIAADGRRAVVATKFAPFIGRTSARQLMGALDASLERLKLTAVDLYYVHFPFPFTDMATFADGLAEAVKSGKAKAVGVSNFSAAQMREIAERLAKADVPLAANEVHYSLLNRKPETNGVLDACRELGVALVAYFPLASGRLTRQPDPAKPGKLDELQRKLGEIAAAHQAKQSQVALNWLLARDACVIPIPGASKARHAEDNLAALSWTLTADEFATLDAAAAAVQSA
ncbi:MAG TPA: aldo/keto reductase [Caulobacteraceae bacterium]|nr:aldo/keto reductase [Caulobacteraceae bacterium]